MERFVATVQRVRREAHDIVTIYFTVDKDFAYTAGQYITVFFADTSTPEGKAYSLSSSPSEAWLSITVKKVGEYSGKLHALRAGDVFSISQAYGFFNPETNKPLVCISAGCGLAPIWSIVKNELEKNARRAAYIFYSNKLTTEIPFYNELSRRQEQHASLHVRHHITRDTTVPTHMYKGRIKLDDCIAAAEEEAAYLLCGSVDFVRDMWQGLTQRGVPAGNISTETFFE